MISSRIYTVKGGKIADIYRELKFNGEMETNIAQVAADGSETYFVRTASDGKRWSLVKKGTERSEEIAHGSFEIKLDVTGLSAQNGQVWLTGIAKDKSIYIYEYRPMNGMALKMIAPAEWLENIKSAEFDGKLINAVTINNKNCVITKNGEVSYLSGTANSYDSKIAAGVWGWILCKTHIWLSLALLWIVITTVIFAASAVGRQSKKLSTRLAAAGSAILFLSLMAAILVVFSVMLYFDGLSKALHVTGLVASVSAEIWLVALLILIPVSKRITARAKTLASQMEAIAEGDVLPREVAAGNDELYRMDAAMQEMCMSLSIRDYEMNGTVMSYKRFVPQQMTELLDRAAVAEVELGDSRRSEGNIGLFSVGNRANARAVLEDSAYIDFINRCFGILDDCVQKNNGCTISTSLRLSNIETMFPNAALDGVKAGLDVLGKSKTPFEDGIPSMKPLMILHKASFLYGVAGKSDRLFPYLSSAELEFLGRFADKFHDTDVRIIVTEAYWQLIKNSGLTGRYIGFVSDGDKNAYKLYEILDAYPELERRQREQYDKKFQEAINLFYHDDFFLARNQFSNILRICPEDGIARWYLFACEHFFNRTGEEETDYRLFGIEDA